MASDDIFYAITILSSVTVGLVFRKVAGTESRRYLSTCIGVALLYLLCGRHCLHLAITVLGNCVLLSVPPLLQFVYIVIIQYIFLFPYRCTLTL